MSRKDTIIIAVLINAGLLIVLFASALKSTSSPQEMAFVPKQRVVEPVLKNEHQQSGVDEVDQALQKLATAPQTQPPAYPNANPASSASSSFNAPTLQTTVSSTANFADDLKVSTAPETSGRAIYSPSSAAAPAEERKTSEFTEIKVKKGDVLEKIARLHHTNVDAIIACNQLASTHLRIGQTLKIPNKKAASDPTSNPPAQIARAASASDGHKYYTVKNGDNPWTIAVKNHMKVDELLKLNGIDQEKARKLKPGDKLLIQ